MTEQEDEKFPITAYYHEYEKQGVTQHTAWTHEHNMPNNPIGEMYELVKLQTVEDRLKEFMQELEKNPDYQLRKSVVREILMKHFGEKRCIEIFEEVKSDE